MIDWNAPTWGDVVHEDSHGSWITTATRDEE